MTGQSPDNQSSMEERISFQKNVPPGHLAEIITHLEMVSPPDMDAAIASSSLTLVHWPQPEWTQYLQLFRRVGAPWLWQSRLVQDEARVIGDIEDDRVEIYLVMDGDDKVGFVELDFRQSGACEIVYFGLIPAYGGKGHGRWLMAQILKRAWQGKADSPAIKRVWLHTCSLDDPRALPFYLKNGFVPFAQDIAISPDPRLTGLYPKEQAPHIPILPPKSR